MRKSQVSSQFNWVFVLIVGGMFLLIFFTMGRRQTDAADVRISATAISGLSTILESARTGTSLSTIIDIPEIEIEFSCEIIRDNIIYSDYRVGPMSKKLPILPTFVPGVLNSRNLITWTMSWDMPFKIMNFLYLANNDMRFFFYFPDNQFISFERLINETFSNNIKHVFARDSDNILDYNEEYSIIVIFSNDDNFVANLDFDPGNRFRKQVRIIQIKPSEDNIFGHVKYFDRNRNQVGSQVAYYGLASFYGAIFSESDEFYTCSMLKAMERFKRVSCIYKQKFERMRESYLSVPGCLNVYSGTVNYVSNYFEYGGMSFCISSGDEISLGDFEKTDFSEYTRERTFYRNIAQSNRQAILNSCELLY